MFRHRAHRGVSCAVSCAPPCASLAPPERRRLFNCLSVALPSRSLSFSFSLSRYCSLLALLPLACRATQPGRESSPSSPLAGPVRPGPGKHKRVCLAPSLRRSCANLAPRKGTAKVKGAIMKQSGQSKCRHQPGPGGVRSVPAIRAVTPTAPGQPEPGCLSIGLCLAPCLAHVLAPTLRHGLASVSSFLMFVLRYNPSDRKRHVSVARPDKGSLQNAILTCSGSRRAPKRANIAFLMNPGQVKRPTFVFSCRRGCTQASQLFLKPMFSTGTPGCVTRA